MLQETPQETLTKKSNSSFIVRKTRKLGTKHSPIWMSVWVHLLVSSHRLVNGAVHNHRRPASHHALLYLLLPVLPSEVLLLCSLSLLPTAMLLSRKRWSKNTIQKTLLVGAKDALKSQITKLAADKHSTRNKRTGAKWIDVMNVVTCPCVHLSVGTKQRYLKKETIGFLH